MDPAQQLEAICKIVDTLYAHLGMIESPQLWAEALTGMAALQEVAVGISDAHRRRIRLEGVDPEEWRRTAPVWREAARVAYAVGGDVEHALDEELAQGEVGDCLKVLAATAGDPDARAEAFDELTDAALEADG